MSSGLDAVRDAYTARWGEPSRRGVFRVSEYEMEIFKWAPETNGEGVDIYATLGASAEDMPGAEPGHRVEYFLGLQPGRDEIASAMAALGLFARREGVLVDHGHTIPADGPLWPGTAMKTLLILRQISDVLPALSPPGQRHVDFLQAVPIFDSERSLKVANGLEALLRRWEQSKTPFWDPARRDGRLDG